MICAVMFKGSHLGVGIVAQQVKPLLGCPHSVSERLVHVQATPVLVQLPAGASLG